MTKNKNQNIRNLMIPLDLKTLFGSIFKRFRFSEKNLAHE